MKATNKAKVRLKLVAMARQKILFVRFNSFTEQAAALGTRLLEMLPAPRCVFDGEVYQVRGEADIKVAVRLLREGCSLVYDPNLLRSQLDALPNPWPIPEEALRPLDPKPIAYMARVWHPEYAEAIAFQLPKYDDDFMIEFRRRLVAKTWKAYRKDLQIWAIADHYEPIVHDVLDQYYDCWWDELLGGDEWNILPPPPDSRYPIRKLVAQDFKTLGVQDGCALWEIHEAYRDKKEAYNSNNLHRDEWCDVDTAFNRILRHYRPDDPDGGLPEQTAAPRPIQELLAKVFQAPSEQVRWYYSYQDTVRGIPHEVAQTEPGADRVRRVLEIMLVLKPAVPEAPAPATPS